MTAAAVGALDDEADIIPRDIRFGIVENPRRHWWDNDPVKTCTADALSIFLPEGERFFIRSLKHFAPVLKDPVLAAEISGYSVQEAFHTREHEDYNRALAKLGYDVAEMEKPVGGILGLVKKPIQRLAITCAIEHLTATISTVTLRQSDMYDNADERYRRLWLWHALEELEHKAVAIDILKAVTPGAAWWRHWLWRMMAMNSTILMFLFLFLRNVRIYMRNDGKSTGPVFWSKLFWTLMVYPGIFRKCIPLVLKYYLPNFDPINHDDQELVRKGRAWLYNDLQRKTAAAGATG